MRSHTKHLKNSSAKFTTKAVVRGPEWWLQGRSKESAVLLKSKVSKVTWSLERLGTWTKPPHWESWPWGGWMLTRFLSSSDLVFAEKEQFFKPPFSQAQRPTSEKNVRRAPSHSTYVAACQWQEVLLSKSLVDNDPEFKLSFLTVFGTHNKILTGYFQYHNSGSASDSR